MNKSLELNFWSILYDSIVFLFRNTESLSKTKQFNIEDGPKN